MKRKYGEQGIDTQEEYETAVELVFSTAKPTYGMLQERCILVIIKQYD